MRAKSATVRVDEKHLFTDRVDLLAAATLAQAFDTYKGAESAWLSSVAARKLNPETSEFSAVPA